MEYKNEIWWQDILAKCSEYGISQERLATFSGISRRHFIRLKKGESVLSESLKATIESSLRKLNPDAPLNLIIDYVRIRFPTTDICHVVNDIMKLGIVHMIHEDFAHNGYDERYCLGEITVSVSQNIKLGCLVEMKGTGCRQFEGMTRKWENNECVSKFGNYNYYRSGKSAYRDEKDCMGETLYIGSRKSEIYFCIYAKDYEQFVKKGLLLKKHQSKTVLKYV